MKTAKQVAKQAVYECGEFEDFDTYQAAYGFLRRVSRTLVRFQIRCTPTRV